MCGVNSHWKLFHNAELKHSWVGHVQERSPRIQKRLWLCGQQVDWQLEGCSEKEEDTVGISALGAFICSRAQWLSGSRGLACWRFDSRSSQFILSLCIWQSLPLWLLQVWMEWVSEKSAKKELYKPFTLCLFLLKEVHIANKPKTHFTLNLRHPLFGLYGLDSCSFPGSVDQWTFAMSSDLQRASKCMYWALAGSFLC